MFSNGGQLGLKSWFQGGGLKGSNEKNFPGSLSLAMTPPASTPLIFILAQGHSKWHPKASVSPN